MAVTGWPTDAGAGQVATEDRWVQMARLWAPEGVAAGVANSLAPSFAAGQVTIATGAAWINGHYAVNDAPVVVPTAADGLVVLRYTLAGNVFAIAFNSGATVPTQTPAVYEIALARVTGGAMTDVRSFTSGGGGLPSFVYYASPGIYTFLKSAYPGLVGATVETVGGGGGGGGSSSTGAGTGSSAAGGAGGGYARSTIPVSDLDPSGEAVTVGAGGPGGATGGNNGQDGNDSVFDTISSEVRG